MRASLGMRLAIREGNQKPRGCTLRARSTKTQSDLAQFKELQLNLELSLNLRKGAELILEKTRAEAITTSRFFSVIQNPYLLDEETHPRRLYLSITSVIVILLTLYLSRAILASVRDRV